MFETSVMETQIFHVSRCVLSFSTKEKIISRIKGDNDGCWSFIHLVASKIPALQIAVLIILKFMRFIKKVGDGQVDLEQIEKEKQHDAKKISEIWSADFASAWTHERDDFLHKLTSVEDWLNGEGEEQEAVYKERLNELKSQQRMQEVSQRRFYQHSVMMQRQQEITLQLLESQALGTSSAFYLCLDTTTATATAAPVTISQPAAHLMHTSLLVPPANPGMTSPGPSVISVLPSAIPPAPTLPTSVSSQSVSCAAEADAIAMQAEALVSGTNRKKEISYATSVMADTSADMPGTSLSSEVQMVFTSTEMPEMSTEMAGTSTELLLAYEEDNPSRAIEDISPSAKELFAVRALLGLQNSPDRQEKAAQVCSGDLKLQYLIKADDLNDRALFSLTGLTSSSLLNFLAEIVSGELKFSNKTSIAS